MLKSQSCFLCLWLSASPAASRRRSSRTTKLKLTDKGTRAPILYLFFVTQLRAGGAGAGGGALCGRYRRQSPKKRPPAAGKPARNSTQLKANATQRQAAGPSPRPRPPRPGPPREKVVSSSSNVGRVCFFGRGPSPCPVTQWGPAAHATQRKARRPVQHDPTNNPAGTNRKGPPSQKKRHQSDSQPPVF